MNEVFFKLRALAHEFQIFLIGAKAHYTFDTRAVIPRAVKQNHLASGGKMRHIALEVPLAFFGFSGFRQCYDSRAARI